MKKPTTKQHKELLKLRKIFKQSLEKIGLNKDEWEVEPTESFEEIDDNDVEAKTRINFSSSGVDVMSNENLETTEQTMVNLLGKFGKTFPFYCG